MISEHNRAKYYKNVMSTPQFSQIIVHFFEIFFSGVLGNSNISFFATPRYCPLLVTEHDCMGNNYDTDGASAKAWQFLALRFLLVSNSRENEEKHERMFRLTGNDCWSLLSRYYNLSITLVSEKGTDNENNWFLWWFYLFRCIRFCHCKYSLVSFSLLFPDC